MTVGEKTVFLDRDGVINADSPEYVKSWAEFHFLPGSRRALKRFSDAGWRIIVITNQSAVGRGMIRIDTLHDMHVRMKQAVSAAGGTITDIVFCPHRPDENCDCRKPEPGLIFQAKAAYGIDLSRAVLIGDSTKDIRCGRNAGVGATVLVRTGNGIRAAAELAERGETPDAVVDDLAAAAEWTIGLRTSARVSGR